MSRLGERNEMVDVRRLSTIFWRLPPSGILSGFSAYDDLQAKGYLDNNDDGDLLIRSQIFPFILTQDGTGSLLDADFLDGYHASAFALVGHNHGTGTIGRIPQWATADTLQDSQLACSVTGGVATLTGTLTGNHNYTLPNADGTIPLGTGAANAVAYWSGTNALTYDSDFSWIAATNQLGVGTASPATNVSVHAVSAATNAAILLENSGIGGGNAYYQLQAVETTGIEFLLTGSGNQSAIYCEFASNSMRFRVAGNDNAMFIDGANQRVAVGTNAPHSNLQTTGAIAAPMTLIDNASTPYLAQETDSTIVVDDSNGNVTVDLPTAVGIDGREYTIIRVGGRPENTVTIDADGSETIAGETTQDIYELESMQIRSDGTNWVIV